MSATEAPKVAAKTAPEMFANAKVPEEPASDTAKEAPSTSAEAGKPKVRSNGVPAAHLAGWALPLLLLVTGVALWSFNHRLALVLFFLVAVVCVVSFVMHRMARRKASRQRVAAAGDLADPLVRGRQRGGFARGAARGGRGGFFGRRSAGRSGGARRSTMGRSGTSTGQSERGSSTTRAGRSTRGSAGAPSGKRSLRDRLRGRTGNGAAGPGGAGRSTTAGGGKRASDSTSTSSRSRRRGGGESPTSGDSSGKRQSWWSRRRGRGTRPDAETSPAAASGTRRSRRGKGSNDIGEGTGGVGSSRGRSRRAPWRRRRKADAIGDADKPSTSSKTRRPKGAGDGDSGAPNEKSTTKRRQWRLRRKERATAGAPGSADSGEKVTGAEDGRRGRGRKQRRREKFRFDDGGFPSPVIKRTPEPAKPSADKAKQAAPEAPRNGGGTATAAAPRPAPSPPLIETDDGGFPSWPQPASPETSSTASNERSTAVSDDVITAYMNAVDPSTGETRARTWGEAESAARRDVEAFEARGRLFRRNAGILQGKEGHVQAQVDNLLRQASLCDRTAQQRRGMAAAFASLADQAITAAEKSA